MPSMRLDAPHDDGTAAVLDRFGHDRAAFEMLRARLRAGAAESDNRVRGVVTPPAAEDLTRLPPPGSPARGALEARGLEAIRRGDVGALLLAGGMATRFSGTVKAGVTAVAGRTFLDLKLSGLARVARQHRVRLRVAAMTSFATHETVASLARPFDDDALDVRCFAQSVSLRLSSDGSLFREGDGRASLYAPGHGDLPDALRRTGLLRAFRDAGVRHLFMSNVDNLGATLDPAIIGAHLAAGRPLTAEVVRKEPGDRGGTPARVDGLPQIVESFRFPEGFDQDAIPVFNTNTFVIDTAALETPFPLTWFVVHKRVDGRDAVQFERLVGELTAFLPTQFLEVERTGPDGRFLPVKDPDELARRRDDILAVLRARGVLDPS